MHLAFLLTLTLILGLFFTGTPSARAAAPTGTMVSVIKVVTGHSVLSLALDKPMPAGEAKTVERKLRGDLQATSGTFAAASVDPIMYCTTQISYFRADGKMHLVRVCSLRQLRWDYRISATVQAIIVGSVNETGLWYWINGVRQPRNSPTSKARATGFTVR